jgi:hypothetical protein
MTFSKEDKAAWMNSEVMHELEKIALAGGLEVSEEAFQPIEEEEWEDEDDTEKFVDAVEKFQEGDEKLGEDAPTKDPIDELLAAHQKILTDAIEKLSWQLADRSRVEAAYKVERALQNIKALMEE